MLFTEFDKIFKDIFGARSATFKRIVEALSGAPLEPGQLCHALEVKPTGGLSEMLAILEAAGMVARDFAWNTAGGTSTYPLRAW